MVQEKEKAVQSVANQKKDNRVYLSLVLINMFEYLVNNNPV